VHISVVHHSEVHTWGRSCFYPRIFSGELFGLGGLGVCAAERIWPNFVGTQMSPGLPIVDPGAT